MMALLVHKLCGRAVHLWLKGIENQEFMNLLFNIFIVIEYVFVVVYCDEVVCAKL